MREVAPIELELEVDVHSELTLAEEAGSELTLAGEDSELTLEEADSVRMEEVEEHGVQLMEEAEGHGVQPMEEAEVRDVLLVVGVVE